METGGSRETAEGHVKRDLVGGKGVKVTGTRKVWQGQRRGLGGGY